MEQNPYQAPGSELVTSSNTYNQDRPSIDEAIERGYDFDIIDLISQAKDRMSGFKGYYWLSVLIIFAIAIPAVLVTFIPILGNIIFNVLMSALGVGIAFMALKHLRGEEITISQLFTPLTNSQMLMPIALATIISGLCVLLGTFLLIIPGIYLIIAYTLINWIIIDNPGIGFWEAMEASRKTISQHWFKVFGLMIVLSLINMIGALVLLIGLIWTAPLTIIATALLYETIFGPRS